MQRNVVIGAAVLLVLGVSGVYGYNIYRNRIAAADAFAACDVPGENAQTNETVNSVRIILGSRDADAMFDELIATREDACRTVRDALPWWRWNFGRELTVVVDPARLRRFVHYRDLMLERLPRFALETLQRLGRSPAEAARFAADLRSRLDASWGKLARPAGGRRLPVWEWPAVLRMMNQPFASGATHGPSAAAP